MMKLFSLVVCVFFTLTTFAQVHQPIWRKNQQLHPTSNTTETGFKLITDVLFELEFKNSDYNRYGVDLIPTLQTGSDFSIGVGCGIRHYDRIDITVIPIFLDVRRMFFQYSFIKTLVEMKGGYGIEADDLFFEPSLGIVIGTQFYSSIGISIQKFKKYEINSTAAVVKIGIKL